MPVPRRQVPSIPASLPQATIRSRLRVSYLTGLKVAIERCQARRRDNLVPHVVSLVYHHLLCAVVQKSTMAEPTTSYATQPNQILFADPNLISLGKRLHESYRSASPFPHVVIDDFLPDYVAERVVETFPDPSTSHWKGASQGPQAGKLGTRHAGTMSSLDPYIYNILLYFNSSPFIRFLESLTGIDGLIPDPHFMGGGLHQIPKGGRLSVHADFNWYEELRLDRRLNVLLYLNPNWNPEWGGHLELWPEDMSQVAKRIEPLFNRLVVFSTTDISYHGHPDPLDCPEDVTRKSMAFYYYTNGRPQDEKSPPHGTLWQRRPGTRDPVGAGTQGRLARIAKNWVPPAIFDAVKRFRRN